METECSAEMDIGLFNDLASALGADQLVEITAVFLAEMDRHLRGLTLAAATGDAAGIVSVAHAIKGSASNLALSRIAQAADALEARVTGCGMEGVASSIADIQDAFRSGRICLEMMVRAQGATSASESARAAGVSAVASAA